MSFSFASKLLLFSSVLLFFGCDKPNELAKKEEEGLKSKMVSNYINQAKNSELSNIERRGNLDKAYALCSTLQNFEYKRDGMWDIAIVYYGMKDYGTYKKMNEKVLKLSTANKDSFGIAKSYGNIGIYYRLPKIDKIDSAYYFLDKSHQVYSKFPGHEYNHGRVLIGLAQILRRAKDYSESESITIKAIKKFVAAENNRYLPMCYTNLGIVSKFLGRYDEAIQYHEQAIEYATGTNEEISETLRSLNNIGTVYKSQKKYDLAKKYYKQALTYSDFLAKRPKRHALLLDNLAYVNFLSNDTAEIPGLFYKSLHIRDSVNDRYGIATNTLHLAEYYKSKGEDSISKKYAIQANEMSSELKNNEELLKSYQILSGVSGSREGLAYANKYIALNDSLVNEERLFRDKFARIRFETDEIAERNLKISRENEILIIAILGLTALFLLGYIIFRQQQSNKELLFAQTQQEANQEIYRLLLNQQIKLEEGRQLEQKRMSEELHDGVLGRLFGVRLSLDGINQRANDGFTEARNKYIEELKSIEKEIRLISHDLGTESLPSDVAYIDAVESLISDLCEVNNIHFEFNNDEDIDWEHIDDQKKVNLFRILQESLQNIFKHAQAESIKINFDYVEDKINLTILDDGIGFKSTKVKKGIGLKNITSRVSQMSGVVQFLSNNNAGTTVSVSVPV